MRCCSVVLALSFASVVGVLGSARDARAASGTCADTAACVAGQVCRIVGAATTGTCTWEATNAQSLIDAINAANADEARDVIFIGDLDPVDKLGAPLPGPVGAEIVIETALADEGGAVGARALPRIRSAITVEGVSSAASIIDINADMRLFLLQVDPATQRRPDLLVKNVTLRDARPSPGALGAGAITVDATATAPVAPLLPELPIVVVEDVRFDGGRGDTATAGAIHNDGAPLRVDGCTFEGNSAGAGAGAITTSTGGVIVSSDFLGNQGNTAGALHVTSATRVDESGATVDVTLQVNATTFEDNNGRAGAVVSLAEAATFGNATFRNNVAFEGSGGAIAARGLRVQTGVFEDNFSGTNGGAISVIDEPSSGPVLIAGSDFLRNSARGNGGAVQHTGATLTIDQCFFAENRANGAGGALHIFALAERNGALADVQITASDLRSNVARPTAVLATFDTTLDERGTDTGALGFTFKGAGSAIAVSNGGTVEIEGSCILGNGADAVLIATAPATVNASGNWWGAADGPAPAGAGVLAGPGLTTAPFLDEPAAPCSEIPVVASPQIFVPAVLDAVDVVGGLATVVDDFTMVDAARGIQVMNGASGQLVPNMRTGVLDIVLTGRNDVDEEGQESVRFAITRCDGDDCAYVTADSGFAALLVITDNGDDVGEGEGEGEGDDCAEELDLSSTAIEFADPAAAAEQTLTITNKSPCEVQLLRPFVQAGASQGFAVDPILQTALLLPTGGSLDVVVRYTPPDPADAPPAGSDLDDGGDGATTGLLRVETTRGTLVEVALGVAQGCACSTTSASGAPWAAFAFAALVALRCKRGLPKRRRIP
jgi:MYXO-CTERM domain-containing protein